MNYRESMARELEGMVRGIHKLVPAGFHEDVVCAAARMIRNPESLLMDIESMENAAHDPIWLETKSSSGEIRLKPAIVRSVAYDDDGRIVIKVVTESELSKTLQLYEMGYTWRAWEGARPMDDLRMEIPWRSLPEQEKAPGQDTVEE